ncbi:cysteine proteinase [Meredithblackwellia eburnea MCA 4105]
MLVIPTKLSRVDALLYLERIQLGPETLQERPSLELLTRLQQAHLLHVPFESTLLHLPINISSTSPSTPLSISGAPIETTVPLGPAAFDRVVRERKGGFCFTLNSTFATLLRTFGFRVSECAGRVYQFLEKDPKEAGWGWGSISHEVLVVDWDSDSDADARPNRWFVDVGFGKGQAVSPIPFKHNGHPIQTSIPSLDFKLERGSLPSDAGTAVDPDPLEWWTLSRLVISTEDDATKEQFWTPIYSFRLLTVAPSDFRVKNFYNSTNPAAIFRTLFTCTTLLPGGGRKILFYANPTTGEDGENDSGERKARLSITDWKGKRVSAESIAFEAGPIKQVLEKEFRVKY